MWRVSLLRPAPSELPQGGNAARVGGCSGAIEGANPFFFLCLFLQFGNQSMTIIAPLQNNLIIDKTFQFAVDIVQFCQDLQDNKHYVIANQLLKSGTSIGANVRESQNAESLPDFIHKFKIAAKEADETEYWLLICSKAVKISNNKVDNLLLEINIIQKIITKIIASSKKRLSTNK